MERRQLYRQVLTVVVTLAACGLGPATAAEPDELTRVRELRLEGSLDKAQALAEETLDSTPLDSDLRIDLHLELARIHDRRGLHRNTRPVAAALQEIETAAAVTSTPSPSARAKIELARAECHYRAETPSREFARATVHADRAAELFREIGDRHGEAEAVHKQGLIHLQRRELDRARELFDRSLELDRAGGERLLFRAEYERHVGFVFLLEGDASASIPYFERSLALRREAGAVDASLFAARTLAAALVDTGRLEEARPHLLYALMVAERIDSPMGKARTGLALGELYEHLGDEGAARIAFGMTLEVARSIGYEGVARRAREALDRLTGSP
jgi:tetratricopeptide (TPR) repeat protein